MQSTKGFRPLLLLVLTLLVTACAGHLPEPYGTIVPDRGKRVEAANGVVSSAHPQASEAGLEMLRKGGNAVDAAIATAFAVSVVEPQMSGLGGGGSMVIWLEDEGRTEYLDFYPAQLAESFRGLRRDDPGPKDLRRTGIPGQVAGLLAALEAYGTLTPAEVLAPAIQIAEEGFPVNQILAQMIARDSAKLSRDPGARRLLLPGGRPLSAGEVLKQPELAASLREIARLGRAGFYEGRIARAVVEKLNAGGHPARLADLAAYEPEWKRPLCAEYRGRLILSAPPPQTGVQVIASLALLEPYDLRSYGLPTESSRTFDLLVSAMRLGMADSPRHIDDPSWEPVPVSGLISREYAESRAELVGTGGARGVVESGDPWPYDEVAPPARCLPLDPYRSEPGGVASLGALNSELVYEFAGGETTHLSVVDREGNAVALTQTISSVFGSGVEVAGFFLNNSGIDFARDTVPFEPDPSTAARWRTRRSTISPTIVLDDKGVEIVIGAPGSGRIPTEILQNLVYLIDFGLDPLAALELPRIYPMPSSPTVQLEHGFDAELLRKVRAMGYRPTAESFGYARLYLIARRGGKWIGVADPRHDGAPRGH